MTPRNPVQIHGRNHGSVDKLDFISRRALGRDILLLGLDAGACSGGMELYTAASRAARSSVGVAVSGEAAQAFARLGQPEVQALDLSTLSSLGRTFDLVIMDSLLSRSVNHVQVLAAVVSLLAKDGQILAVVPNGLSGQALDLVLGHPEPTPAERTFYLSVKSLAHLCRPLGLVPTAIAFHCPKLVPGDRSLAGRARRLILDRLPMLAPELIMTFILQADVDPVRMASFYWD